MGEDKVDPYEKVGNFRAEERAKMLAEMSELIDDARKRAKSHNTLAREKPKWTNLAGKLIWYRDQILRSMNYEALHKEMEDLRELFNEKIKPQDPKSTTRLP